MENEAEEEEDQDDQTDADDDIDEENIWTEEELGMGVWDPKNPGYDLAAYEKQKKEFLQNSNSLK